jgi:cadmium resistance protein CadD (predicted permease)
VSADRSVIGWSLWIGVGLILVAVLARALDLIPVTVIVGLLGLLALGFGGYGALDEAAARANLRRRAARVQKERERGR